MTVTVTIDNTIFAIIKTLYSLKTYQAHDIETMPLLRSRAPLPFSCAANDAILLLLMPAHHHPKHSGTTQCSNTMLFSMGVLYGVLTSMQTIIFVDSYVSEHHVHEHTTHATSTPHSIYSVHAVMHTNAGSVPLYIDQLVNAHADSIAYQDAMLYTFTQCIQKYWESHRIQILLLNDEYTNTPTQSKLLQLKTSLDALQQLPVATPLPDDVIAMLLMINRTLSLSRTESRQLRTLVDGCYASTQSLPEPFLSYMNTMNATHNPPMTPEEKNIAFNRCCAILMESLP